MRQRRDRGALLGVVLVLSTVLFAASIFAYWGLKSDTSTAGADRLSRQLFDCAEQGLGIAKQYFSQSSIAGDNWMSFYQSPNVCATGSNLLNACAPNGPFPTNPQGSYSAGPATGYPNGLPWTQQIVVNLPNGGTQTLQFTFGIFNIPKDANDTQWLEKDRQAVIYSRCIETQTNRSRSVSAIITAPPSVSNDYLSTDGHGMRNQGNFNNGN
jgi:hypothetical protein